MDVAVTPRVIHRRDAHKYPDAVWIDRKTRWGNKFHIGPDGTRKEVIAKHAKSLSPKMKALIRKHLAGKVLICHCKPKACHGDTLLAIANPPTKGLFSGLL